VEDGGAARRAGAAAAGEQSAGGRAVDAERGGDVALRRVRTPAGAGTGARGVRRDGRWRYSDCDAGRHAGVRYELAGGDADREPRRRHRRRQVRHGDGELRGIVRVRVVVTGAAGMIGSNLVHGLNAIGIDDVIAVDDLTEGMKFRNLLGARISDYFDRSEFYDRFALGELGRVDAIFHEGACSDTMEHNGRYMLETNY